MNNHTPSTDAAPTASAPSGAHHLTPASIVALVADLEACEAGTEEPAIADRDWRTRCGVIARVIRHLAECAATLPAAPIAQPVGQVRNDLDRVNVVWFGPLPAHGTSLYAAPGTTAIGQQADSDQLDVPMLWAIYGSLKASGQTTLAHAVSAHLSATNSGTESSKAAVLSDDEILQMFATCVGNERENAKTCEVTPDEVIAFVRNWIVPAIAQRGEA
jgi:hypothetical protein